MKRRTTASKALSSGSKSYKRIVLKVTGEGIGGVGDKGVSEASLQILAKKLIQASKTGLQIAIVIGGGNILRGVNFSGSKLIRQFASHQMGMIATAINGLALSETLTSMGKPAELFSAFKIGNFVNQYNVICARKSLEEGKIVILAGGTGNPFVTTDTCAAIRAAELGADAVFKATKVDGVYSEDPAKNSKAKRYDKISYDKVINDRLAVMDLTATKICQDAKVPIVVFNFEHLDKLPKVISGRIKRTIVQD